MDRNRIVTSVGMRTDDEVPLIFPVAIVDVSHKEGAVPVVGL